MKNIFTIFVNDFKRILKKPIAALMLFALALLPGLYAWIYINCTWDPYQNTGNLPIAIVNKDKGANILDSNINMGNSLVENLKDNKSMRWLFLSDNEAEKQVRNSDVYGKIVFPENFSQELITVFNTGKIIKPQLDFTINHKKNPVTPIIVNKAVTTIKDNINQNIANQIILKALETIENKDLLNKFTSSIDKFISELEKSKDCITDLKSIFGILEQTANSTNDSLSKLRKTLPTIDSLTETTKDGILNIQGAMDSMQGLSVVIDNTIVSLETQGNDIIHSMNFDPQRENAEIISNKIDNVDAFLSDEKQKIQRIQDFLSNTGMYVSLDTLSPFQNQLQNIINEINDTQTIIANNRETMNDIKSINKRLKSIYSQNEGVYRAYQNDIRNGMNDAYYYSTQSLNSISSLLTGVNNVAQKSDSALSGVIKALDNTKELTDNLNNIGSKIQKEIDKIIEILQDSKKNELYDKIINIMKNNPKDVADFLSKPVKTNEIAIYGTDSKGQPLAYGSKLSPFYSILACWVGGIGLISVVRTEVTDMEGIEEFQNYEKFLGRFGIFGVIGLTQGFIIAIGDLLLKVQVLHIFYFIFTIMMCSLVYVFFIYTLAVCFGRIGHALSILALVIQVAGSGGTFPIELLPRIYGTLQLVMPLYPGMNALRETIAGFYGHDYAIYMLMLFAHTIIPLLLGLVLRNSIINLKQKFNRQLEKSHLITTV
ncbi:hypothetical protein PIROE2DRAFT_69843 [Piromyces sp. E2]|nr:hypothetical protein PIROE2DRAFT_69843 [Piromyces sp. E2]|eukprot:OUM59528.1 hypothetical protein PIROE2DRAFT_69843 [Piromyces sp. E2]